MAHDHPRTHPLAVGALSVLRPAADMARPDPVAKNLGTSGPQQRVR